MGYKKNVFVNCPFDEGYKPLLRAMIFAVVKLGFEPKLSETRDGAVVRMDGILELIRSSQFGIHDLSRCEAMQEGEFPRFNMPFELGLDLGAREFATSQKFKTKKILVLEEQRYRYQKVLSDLSGCDIYCHGGEAEQIIRELRKWFAHHLGYKNVESGGEIWEKYNEFQSEAYSILLENGFDAKDLLNMAASEYIMQVKNWLKDQN